MSPWSALASRWLHGTGSSKSAKDDLTQAEENELRKLARVLEGDSE